MRIYIKDYNLKKMQNIITLLNKSGKFNIVEMQCREIYSNEGIYNINMHNVIEQLYIDDKEIITIENYYNNYTLLIDNSIIMKREIHQIPAEHILQTITRYFICSNEKSLIKLVIEYNTENNENNNENNENNSIKGNNLNFNKPIPFNFYFESKNEIDLNNDLIKKEIIVFLSLLN